MSIFIKKLWKNRLSEFPNRRRLTKENGTSELVTVSREEGVISQEGDAFSEDNMNDMEERVNAAFEALAAVRVTLPAANWSADALPSQTVNVSWMTEDWQPGGAVVIPSDDVDENKAMETAFSCVNRVDTAAGTITFTCFSSAPEVDLTILVMRAVEREV